MAELSAPVVVAAHGSWETGPLPTQLPRAKLRASDLFGFKAHFADSRLPEGLMPLLAFPGGYGGMVHCERGKASISFCLRRDVLTRLRAARAGDAAEVAFGHLMRKCRGVCDALGNSIGSAGVVTNFVLYQRIGLSSSSINEVVDSTTPDTAFRWSSTDQQWIFNINTKPLVKNTQYFYRIDLNDGTAIFFAFGLK